MKKIQKIPKKNVKNTAKTAKRTLVPLGDKVLVKETKADQKTKAGIVLPDSVDLGQGPKEGKVIAVGEGKIIDEKMIPLSVQKGDVVLFGRGEHLSLDGEEYFLVRESDISAKII